MSWLTREASPAWIVVAILVSMGAIVVYGNLSNDGVLVKPSEYPGAVVWVLLIAIAIWMKRYGVTVEPDKSPRGIRHANIVYTLVLAIIILLLLIRLIAPGLLTQ
jgi:putative Mn2+ efflux pump MntP